MIGSRRGLASPLRLLPAVAAAAGAGCLATAAPPAPSQEASPAASAASRRGLAPDDLADPARTHDYRLSRNGAESVFVWIPPFDAYQLLVPANCGPDNAARPEGTWVASRPPAGTEGADWAREGFGGFYAAKYEAARADATPGDAATGAGATSGGSLALKVAPRCVPWTDVEWPDAILACQEFDPHADLLADDEWTALAVWATIHAIQVQGNDDRLKASGDAATTFRDDPGVPGHGAAADGKDRALTGTGTHPAWQGDRNLTTHTGTTAGVYDLAGNVREWTGTVGLGSGSRWLVGLRLDDGLAPEAGSIAALATAGSLRRLGLPRRTGPAEASFGGDTFSRESGLWTPRAARGGDWSEGGQAGVWRLHLSAPRSARGDTGFRPVLRYHAGG